MKDDEIIRKLRAGDPAALEKLMDKYIPYVSAIVWNILWQSMSKEDAEEVVSDVFVSAWRQASQIQSEATKAWLGAVARNKAKSALRKCSQELSLEEDFLELPGEDTPSSHLERREERELVQRAVDQLPVPDREVFLRHYYYAQSVAEIAGYMHLNQSTVKTKLRRGRLRLKELLMRWDVR